MADRKKVWIQWPCTGKVLLWSLVPFLISLILLVVLVGATIHLAKRPADGVLWSASTGKIQQVDPQGPAAAVVQPGDAILALDGVPLNQLTELYARKQPGDEVRFTVSRNGQEWTATLVLAKPTWTEVASRLEPLFIALAFWIIGLVVLASKPADRTARLFCYAFGYDACALLVFGALSTTGLLWADQLFSLSLWLLGPVLIHLHLYFPRPTRAPRQYRYLAIWYSLATVGWLLSIVEGRDWILFNSPFSIAVRLQTSASLLAAVILLVNAYKSAISAQVRREIRLVVLGAVLALVPPCVLTVLPDALFGFPLISYNTAFLFLLAIPCAYSYSIIRYRLIHLDQRINRGLGYIILTLLLAIFYTVLDTGLEHITPLTSWDRSIANMALALLVVAAFMPARNWLQRVADSIFYGGWYDYRTAVQKISQALDRVANASELVEALPHSLADTMKLECSCLLLRDQREDFYAHSVVFPACQVCRTGALRLESGSVVSQYFRQESGPITGDLLREKVDHSPLTPNEQRLLACTLNRVWVPLIGRDELIGILVLGRKQYDDPFDGQDFQILEVAARHASITIQNTSLLFELQQHAADMERLHQQLIRAREEERKRLARELHDEIIQALVGLNYDLSQIETLDAASHKTQVHKLLQQVYQLMGDLRKICKELRPPALDSLGLVSALRSRLREIESEGILRVELIVRGNEEISLPEELEVCFFRVLQEALVNVQKHAQATQVTVRLAIDPTRVCLSVQDNGCGFSIPAHWNRFMDDGRFGLVGARERLELVGGKLTLRSISKQGTCLEAWVPLATLQSTQGGGQ